MAGTIDKGLIGKQDKSSWDGSTTKTFTRTTSSGYALSLNKIDYHGVDICKIFGGGVLRNSAVIDLAIAAIGTPASVVPLYFSHGAWTITKNVEIADDFQVVMAHGAIVDADYSVTDSGTAWTWTNHAGSIWKLDQTINEPSEVFESGAILYNAADVAGMTAAGSWTWVGSKLYVWTIGSDDPNGLATNVLQVGYLMDIKGDFVASNITCFTGYMTPQFSQVKEVQPEWFGNDVHRAAYSIKGSGGEVALGPAEYALTAHTLYPAVGAPSIAGAHLWPGTVIRGVSHTKSILKLAADQNCDCVRSWNFADLTTTDTWLVIHGMPTGFGVATLSIDGNKANNATGSGAGCRFYGKGLVLGGTVLIHDCDGPGWYSEAGSDPGNTTYADTIQGNTGMLITCYNNGDGFTWRGPHDFYIAGINSYKNGGYALECTKEPEEYTGKLEVGWVHTFGNTLGVKIDCNFGGELLTFEDRTDFPGTWNWGEVKIDHLKVSGGNAAYFDTGGNLLTIAQEQFQCNHIRVVHRWRLTAIPDRSVYINSDECKIGELNVWCGKVATDTGPPIVYHQINFAVAAVEIAGIRNNIGHVAIEGTTTHGSDCTGLLVTGAYNRITGGYIQRFKDDLAAGTSGLAIQLGTAGTEVSGCDIHCDTRYNYNALLYAKAGNGNKFVGHLYQSAGHTGVHASSVLPDADDDFNIYEFNTNDPGPPIVVYPERRSRYYGQTDTFPLDATGITVLTAVEHNCCWTPLGKHVQLTPFTADAVSDWTATATVVAITATEITVAVDVLVASVTALTTGRVAIAIRI